MENHLQNAIEQMRRGEEEGIRFIYSHTYNFVYLRAKNIFKREEDVQKLVKEVYLQAVEQAKRIREENLYEWLGKWTYILGSAKYRRKKVREATNIEWPENNYAELKTIGQDSTREVIGNVLEELPDMFQATLYAFYYDHMRVADIAKAMDYSVGAIINRLNYTHKYLEKALEFYQEETKVNVQLSPEAISKALQDWSSTHCMSESAAQSVHMAICRELGFSVNTIEPDESELAGLDKTIVKYDKDDLSIVYDELEYYSAKPGIDKRQLVIVGAVAVAFIVLVLIVVLAIANKYKDNKDDVKTPVNQQEDIVDSPQEDVLGEDVVEDELDEEVQEDTQEDEDISVGAEQEYILPNSNTQKLTRADLQGLSKEQLRLARNEIYARHGMIFGAQDLAAYFSSKSWYTPTVAYDDFYDTVTMSEIEAANVSLIVEMEDETE